MAYMCQELKSIILTLIKDKVLNEKKLTNILDLKMKRDDAMRIRLTNHYAYIMQLIRENSRSTERASLNRLTEEIKKYEDLLWKRMDKDVERYSKLSTSKLSEILK